jgi:hypothetical protein
LDRVPPLDLGPHVLDLGDVVEVVENGVSCHQPLLAGRTAVQAAATSRLITSPVRGRGAPRPLRTQTRRTGSSLDSRTGRTRTLRTWSESAVVRPCAGDAQVSLRLRSDEQPGRSPHATRSDSRRL